MKGAADKFPEECKVYNIRNCIIYAKEFFPKKSTSKGIRKDISKSKVICFSLRRLTQAWNYYAGLENRGIFECVRIILKQLS